MLFSFFKSQSGEGSFDHIVTKSISMLGDARHSFDLASLALLTDADASSVADDIRATDDRINHAEQEMRSELIVHVAVQGGADIGSVLAFTLLLKKIERIGDQAKNILDLAELGVSLADRSDVEAMLIERQVVSQLFGEAAELLADPDTADEVLDEFAERVDAIGAGYQTRIGEFLVSDLPGRQVVPLAIYYRYLRRIVANLLGVVRTSAEPIHHSDDEPIIDDLED
jgi:phosphate uptake regulator